MLYPHNQRLFSDIEKQLDAGVHDVLYVQGTGVGKSYIFFELVNSRFAGCKILYVVPQHAIRENLVLYPEASQLKAKAVHFATYNSFDKDVTKKYMKYDVIFFDEAHHMGAPRRSRNILKLKRAFLEAGKYVFGMTATPQRSSDGINVASMFHTTCYGNTIFDCIEQKLMPPVEYYIGSKLGSTRHVDFTLSEAELSKAINMYPRNKWIIFFDTIKQLEYHKDFIQKLYPQHKILVIHSKCKGIKDRVDDVTKCDKCVVLSVNSLLEGIHVEGIEAVLLLRRVQSLTVFQQMLGRITKIGAKTSPVFLDCTGSAMTLLTRLMSYNYGRSYVETNVDMLYVNTLNEIYTMRRYPKRKKTIKVHLSNLRKYDAMQLVEKMSKKYFCYNNKWYVDLKACCEDLGISYGRVTSRINKGEVPGDAVDEVVKLTRFFYDNQEYRNLKECLETLDIVYEDYVQAKTSKYRPEQVITRLLKRRASVIVIDGVEYGSIYGYLYQHNIDINKYLLTN